MSRLSAPESRAIPLLSACLAVQGIAAIYFVIDGIDDVIAQFGRGLTFELIMECLVAVALLLAVVISAGQLRRAIDEAHKRDNALKMARGSTAELLDYKFREWSLSRAEAEIALYAMNGCSIAEIARMRNAAEGTVRSQLSQIYSKAGVASQAMLLAHFIEELV